MKSIRDLIPWRATEAEVPACRSGDPFAPLRRDMNRLFDSFFDELPFLGASLSGLSSTLPGRALFSPTIDVTETAQEIVVKAEVPGLNEQDLNVTLEHNSLVISGEKKQTNKRTEEGIAYNESSWGAFRRVLPLEGIEINEGELEATLNNGVLKIHLPKKEQSKPNIKRINIKSN